MGVMTQAGQILQKIQTGVQFPAPRTQSRLLPLLPESTLLYVATPNYGEASHQALAIFHQELQTNPELQAWWKKNGMAAEAPKIDDAFEKFYQLSQYLGDEIVMSAASDSKDDPKFLLLAEVRKPGLKDFLQRMLKEQAGKTKPAALVMDPAELAATNDLPSNDPVILVRPDLVVLAENLATLRPFNANLENNVKDFALTDFGKRLNRGYDGGATIIAGGDIHRIFDHIPSGSKQNQVALERTGFSDMKFLVWEHRSIGAQEVSEMELSFMGPRRGLASWLASPAPMGSLDFVSPNALLACGLLLKNPAEIFDDVIQLATLSNPNSAASLAQAQQGMNLNLREDLFSNLSGEIAFEFDTLPPQTPVWKLVFKAKNPDALLATFHKFFLNARLPLEEGDVDGVTSQTIRIPSGKATIEISYAMVDGYLVIASGRDTLADTIRLHRSGGSLAKSSQFAAALPPVESGSDVSAVFYEDPVAMAALNFRNTSPEIANSFLNSRGENKPAAFAVYADDTTLREVSRSGGADAGAIMMIAAVAIPNLLRARISANEASAVAMVRTANTAQITYAVAYPQQGYARGFANLGPDPNGSNTPTPQHAGFIDSTLGDSTCTAGAWCTKAGYRFTITSTCKTQRCRDYVVTATPVNASSGSRNFCSTSDAVVRYQVGPPLQSPLAAAECHSWPPLRSE